MKTTFILIFTVWATITTSAQKINSKEVPSSVQSALTKAFPKAEKPKWTKEGENYEAEFEVNEEETSVTIDALGKILETEIEIEIGKLPKGVVDFVKSNYAQQKVKEAARITDAAGTVTYEAEIKGKELLFSSEGKFIKELKN